jgi:acetoin utilization protein AcuB
MFVQNHMTSPAVTVAPETSVKDAAEILRSRGFHQLPVVGKDRHLLGIVSDRDIRSATAYDAAAHADLHVEEIMTADPQAINQDATLEEALSMLCLRQFNALPVVDHGRLVGIITRHDILMAFHDLLGLDQPGSRIEIAIPHGAPDIVSVMAALSSEDEITSIMAARLRRDGDEPVLYLRTRNPNGSQIERKLRAKGAILLAPEKSKRQEVRHGHSR